MKLLFGIPPMTQLNTPYPASAYLMGYLKSRPNLQQWTFEQVDFALELFLSLFSQSGLAQVAEVMRSETPHSHHFFLHNLEQYLKTIEPTIRFLQGKDSSLAYRIIQRQFLPEGPRFNVLEDWVALESSFGSLGIQDQAQYLASLYLDDLADVIQQHVDPEFSFAKYAERLAASQASFDGLYQALRERHTLVDDHLTQLTRKILEEHQPDCLALTVPFPGNVYGALRIAGVAKRWKPDLKVILGGGYVNTELRKLQDARIFEFVDYITLDDGERPLECLLEHFLGFREKEGLLRAFLKDQTKVIYVSSVHEHDVPMKYTGIPTYRGLKLNDYVSIFEVLNPMHRLWSSMRWNKLTLAHGCYWKKCSFCDVSLDYIHRYDPASIDLTIDRILALIEETGSTGFHFVDEAAPPALLKALSLRLLERKVVISWWGNVRFEKTFTPELTELMAQAGCIAVSGGLEVASDRLLQLMQKGVSVEQVARVTRAFTQAGIFVHAYLMYGFPTQTMQETLDSLEYVRQLFLNGCLHSAYWHRFSVTSHSPIGLEPEKYGIQLQRPKVDMLFAENDLPFTDPTPCNHELMGEGLKTALWNYMHGSGFDVPVHEWFKVKKHKTQVPTDCIQKAVEKTLRYE